MLDYHRFGRFPADQTAKVSDVYALKQVQDYDNVEEVADSIQKILVEIEVTKRC